MERKSYFQLLIEELERGIKGENEGIPFGFDRLTNYLPNIQKATYYSIGGEKGSGKTALTDYMFLYSPIKWYINNLKTTHIKLEIIYWSMEISLANKLAKYASSLLFDKFGILTDINYILSRGKNRINDEIYNYTKLLKNDFDVFEDIVTIFDEPINPTGFNKFFNQFYEKRGAYEKINEFRTQYIPNDKNLFVINIIDHIGLTKKELGLNKKDNIDKLSNYIIQQRNKHGLTTVAVAQFNRSISVSQREMVVSSRNNRDLISQLRPQENDWKDTSGIGEDANVLIGLFSPNRYEIPEYDGYNIIALTDRFRSINLVKTRDGTPDIAFGLGYLGEIGKFIELPRPDDKNINKLYQEIKTIKKYTDGN